MTRRVGLIDTTLRDGNQSLWATRMTTGQLLPTLERIDAAGYDAIEHVSAVHMDACVRYLGENPWDRLRVVRERVRRTPIRMLGLSQNFSISSVLPDDVVDLFIRTSSKYLDERWITAPLNDVRGSALALKTAIETGNTVEGGVQFTLSPVHTDEFFVNTAKELAVIGVHGIVLKDAGGLLTPERASALVPKIIEAVHPLPVRCHSHCVTGLGPATNIAAVQAGAVAIWTSTSPLSNGASLPGDESMARDLRWLGFEVDVDDALLAENAEYWRQVARGIGRPTGATAAFDVRYFDHQMPGGMISNFRSQLAKLGLEHRIQEVLEEMPRVRGELGYPNIQTPYSQFVATQAFLNVLYGRYEVVPTQIERYILGYWGRVPGEIDADVRDRVAGGKETVDGRPGSFVEPVLDRIRAEQGPFDSDEDLLLATLFMPEMLDRMRRGIKEPNLEISGDLSALVRGLTQSPGLRRASISIS